MTARAVEVRVVTGESTASVAVEGKCLHKRRRAMEILGSSVIKTDDDERKPAAVDLTKEDDDDHVDRNDNDK